MQSMDWTPKKTETMMAAVIDHLRVANGPVSGEELSRGLGAVRNTVWKCIERLRILGYQIDGTPHEGYRLIASPDTPFPWEITWQLPTAELGHQAVYFPAVTSTNDIARQMARNGAPHGLLIVADAQTAGRGRLGRSWVSSPGTGLWFSLLLRPMLPPTGVALFPIMTGVAVAQAIAVRTGLPALLKWPNDVLLAGRKACGVLLEMSAEAEAVHYLVLGIGVNVNGDAADFPSDLRSTATSLKQESGRAHARVPLLRQILLEIEQRYFTLLNEGPAKLLAEAAQLSHTLGRGVDIHGPNGVSFSGLALQIEKDGALRVRGSDGQEKVFYAGDVSLRVKKDRVEALD